MPLPGTVTYKGQRLADAGSHETFAFMGRNLKIPPTVNAVALTDIGMTIYFFCAGV
jgi:hypothetical protein